jgi:hypothetical protein
VGKIQLFFMVSVGVKPKWLYVFGISVSRDVTRFTLLPLTHMCLIPSLLPKFAYLIVALYGKVLQASGGPYKDRTQALFPAAKDNLVDFKN